MIKKIENLIYESDRGCVIVAAAILDEILAAKIKREAKARGMSNTAISRMMDMSGPLSNFSSKIYICRAFGLIDENCFHDLLITRKLRNSFAHETDNASFLNPTTSKKIRSMYFVKDCMKNEHKEILANLQPNKNIETENPKDWKLISQGLLPIDKSMFCVALLKIASALMQKQKD
ncbi:MltR family transcriptional regulator [Pseudomonas sp. KB-10]|uniref:MltR family transcriptional regulator n=1 Tax=Pseudomonas sp. KB-10 TaxID=2292264 RepID=UPI001BAFD3F8